MRKSEDKRKKGKRNKSGRSLRRTDGKEKLELRWHGKDDWENPEPHFLIRKETHLSDYEGIDDNLLIYGDNLLGLKTLERDYTGKVKCIYIDPPYNTKNLFEHYKDNLEHSLWLNMMKERLVIMYKLLREDGTIWISIDDDECHYLKVMCDEIFGRKNFIANLVWQKKSSPQNDAKWISDVHDHILVYATNKEVWRPNLLARTNAMNKRYKNLDNDPRGPWMLDNLTCNKSCKERPNLFYEIRDPITGTIFKPNPNRVWACNEEKMKKRIIEKRIIFPKKKNGMPLIKRYLYEVKSGISPISIWFRDDMGDNSESKREAIAINPKDVFSTPKPERLIQRIFHLATNQGDIVLDSFAGSGTTGAVAHKMERRWIMIELGDHCHTHIIPRMTKVIHGEDSGGITEKVGWKGGGAFEYYEMAPSLLEKNH